MRGRSRLKSAGVGWSRRESTGRGRGAGSSGSRVLVAQCSASRSKSQEVMKSAPPGRWAALVLALALAVGGARCLAEPPPPQPPPVEQSNYTVEATSEPASTQEPTQESTEAPEVRINEVRETELEAIAAVDASIGFGSELFGSSLSTEQCYDEYGNARFCEPPFENIAFERQVRASSECGSPPTRFCTAHNDQVRNCHMCDARKPKRRHPTAYLTDLNNPSEPTCWVSAPVRASNQSSPQPEQQQQQQLDGVTLELNFNKQFEIVYVNLQFCSLKPDSVAIYRSLDAGKSWLPYQFYSSQCARVYGRPQSERAAARQLGQVQCSNASQLGSPTRIAFSPLDGVPAGVGVSPLERSEWISATDIRISLDKHQPAWIYAHSPQQQQLPQTGKDVDADDDEGPLTSPSDTFSYAVADLTVGARCKCHGHASRCVHGREGQLECDCRHNTAGRDCDKCAPFHFDRPWAPASQQDANPCQPCNCNGHSRKCHFDQDLYRLSGKRSGGVCMGCRDNTDGRFCHYCKEGFTRDHSKPMSDKEACKHCNCHPIGSLGKVCNQTSGQCPCKEGVVGLQCSRCAAGYQQSRSLTEPCIKLPENENDINYYPPEAPGAAQHEPQAAPEAALPGATPANRAAAAAGFANELSSGADTDPPSSPASDKDDELDLIGGAGELATSRKRARPPKRRPAFAEYAPADRIRSKAALDFYGAPEETAYAGPQKDFEYYPAYLRAASPHNKPAWLAALEGAYGGRKKPSFANRYMASYGPQPDGEEGAGSGADMIGSAEYGASLQGYHSRDYNRISQAPAWSVAHQPPSRARGGGGGAADFGGPEEALDSSLEAVCNQCGKKTRRLSQRKFCQADYAIRAKALVWQVGDDWTRLVVEILDIFKSPLQPVSSSRQLVGAGEEPSQLLSARFQDNLLKQAPDETLLAAPSSQTQQLNDTQLESQAKLAKPHRLLIGSRQSIWIPSEDFQCKCPSLIVGVDYLLLGPLDSQRGLHSLQLDRHGVATRWNTMSHQAKLMKYQRNQERGKCAPRL